MNVTAPNIGSGPTSSSSTASHFNAPNAHPLYQPKRVLDDTYFNDPDTVLDEHALTELENLIYNNNPASSATNDNIYTAEGAQASTTNTKKTKNKMLPPQQQASRLAQLPTYSYQRSFREDSDGVDTLDNVIDLLAISPTRPDRSANNQRIINLFTDFKLSPYHSLDTFGRFVHNSLNLKTDVVKEIVSNPRIQLWIDKIQCHGFVSQSMPRSGEARKRLKVPPVRCELCKFYGHLSHTCSIKDLAFKLNSVLKNGACRCHICGQLGHPAEAGLCPFIACSFCFQNGHWNYMCPNKDKISRTLCFKCQRYGHSTEVGNLIFFVNDPGVPV